jgi:hypothetical protein
VTTLPNMSSPTERPPGERAIEHGTVRGGNVAALNTNAPREAALERLTTESAQLEQFWHPAPPFC